MFFLSDLLFFIQQFVAFAFSENLAPQRLSVSWMLLAVGVYDLATGATTGQGVHCAGHPDQMVQDPYNDKIHQTEKFDSFAFRKSIMALPTSLPSLIAFNHVSVIRIRADSVE